MSGRREVAGSVVIAAHNEAATIGQCLNCFEDAYMGGEYEVVVVSNGSSDATAAASRACLAAAPRATVLELAEASKIRALQRGDEYATAFPRAYIDADIRIDRATIDGLFERLRMVEGPAVAAPTLQMDTSASSWPVRAYYRVWSLMPYITDGVIGVGVYAVNRAGKERIGAFPDVINDDEWVRRQFAPEERLCTPGVFVAQAARTLPALVRQRARTETGNLQFGGGDAARRTTSVSDLIFAVRRRDVAAADAMCFLAVVLASRLLARWRRLRGTSQQWSTDLTSRPGAPATDAQQARTR